MTVQYGFWCKYIYKKKTIGKKEKSNTRKLTKNSGLYVRIKLMTL